MGAFDKDDSELTLSLSPSPALPPSGKVLLPTMVFKPLGANNELWPPSRARILVTFTAVDGETVSAIGQDPDHNAYAFVAAPLPNAQQALLLDALRTSVNVDSIGIKTVVIPVKGDDGGGPRFTLNLA